MDKIDKFVQPHIRRCSVCEQKLTADHSTTEIAKYVKETGNLMITSGHTCCKCKEEMIQIRHHVERHSLEFGKDSQVFKTFINPQLKFKKYPIFGENEEQNTYRKYLENEIKRVCSFA